jgi:twitching motility protein PilI
MADKINLRLYQEELLAKIQAKEAVDADATNSRLGVVVGQDYVLVNLTDISEVVPMPECSPVPLTKPWFLGLTNIRGNLYAVNDLSLLITNSPEINQTVDHTKSSEARLLLLNGAILDQVGLLVDRVIGLRHSNLLTVRVLKSEPAFCYTRQQYEDDQGRIWNELNVQVLVDSKVFLQPSLL